MSEHSEASWTSFRAYLRLLAESYVDSHLKPHIDLSGIVQQTLLEAHQNARDGKVEITLPWLRKILSNNLADEIRRLQTGKRDFRRERSISESLEQSSLRLDMLLSDHSPRQIDRLAHQEKILKLSEALEKLPASQREAIVLQTWQGWTLADIAKHMGRTPQAVARYVQAR